MYLASHVATFQKASFFLVTVMKTSKSYKLKQFKKAGRARLNYQISSPSSFAFISEETQRFHCGVALGVLPEQRTVSAFSNFYPEDVGSILHHNAFFPPPTNLDGAKT
jgi:hypothetical protein